MPWGSGHLVRGAHLQKWDWSLQPLKESGGRLHSEMASSFFTPCSLPPSVLLSSSLSLPVPPFHSVYLSRAPSAYVSATLLPHLTKHKLCPSPTTPLPIPRPFSFPLSRYSCRIVSPPSQHNWLGAQKENHRFHFLHVKEAWGSSDNGHSALRLHYECPTPVNGGRGSLSLLYPVPPEYRYWCTFSVGRKGGRERRREGRSVEMWVDG